MKIQDMLTMDKQRLMSVPSGLIMKTLHSGPGSYVPFEEVKAFFGEDLLGGIETHEELTAVTERLRKHVYEMFADDVNEYVAAFERAYASEPRGDVSSLVASISNEHTCVIIGTWSALTSQGVEQIEKAKWIHRCLAATVLRIFGVPVSDDGSRIDVDAKPSLAR